MVDFMVEFFAGEKNAPRILFCVTSECRVYMFKPNKEDNTCPCCEKTGMVVQDLRYSLNKNL
jgi:hypothetical protein